LIKVIRVHRFIKDQTYDKFPELRKKPLAEEDEVGPFGENAPENDLTLLCIFGFYLFVF
jgi:hypothetical protein